MADDEHKPEKKDAKKDAHAAEAAPAKGGGMVPIIAAVIVLAAIGCGVGWFFAKSLSPAAVDKPGAEHAAGTGAEGEGHGTEGHGEGEGKPAAHGSGLLSTGKELDVINLKGNVSGSGGTRYVTMDVGIWVPIKDFSELNEPSVRRLIQARLEETVKTYQLDDLGSPNIQARMKKDFATAVERLLRSVEPGRAAEEKFVLETTVTSLLTQ